MTNLNKKIIAVAVAVIILAGVMLGLGISAIDKINRLNDEIEHLNSRLTQIDYNNGRTQNAVDNLKFELQRQFEEQNRNYYGVSHEVTDVNAENNTATVEVYFSLKESPLSGEVEVSFGKGNQFSQIAATKLASGKFMAEIELAMDKDYEISYSVALTSIKTEKILEINVWEQFKYRFNAGTAYSLDYYSGGRITAYDKVYIDFWLGNSYSGNDKLKVKTAVLEIFKGNNLIKTINIMDYAVQQGGTYEQFGYKDIVIDELTYEDLGETILKIAVTDNFGLQYVF